MNNFLILAAVLIGCAVSEPFHRWLKRSMISRRMSTIKRLP
jgi:hypothetical protein